MQIFLHGLDGSQSVACIQENESFDNFVNNNNLNGFRLVCQGCNITEATFTTLFENANVGIICARAEAILADHLHLRTFFILGHSPTLFFDVRLVYVELAYFEKKKCIFKRRSRLIWLTPILMMTPNQTRNCLPPRASGLACLTTALISRRHL